MGRGEGAREVIRSTIKLVERKGILELLGRWNKLKMWTDKIEVEETDPEKRDKRIAELLVTAGGKPLSIQ